MNGAAFRDLAEMAFRNLGRHRVKTVVTTTAVAVSVALYIFMDAWLLGMNLESKRNIVSYEIGAVKLQRKSYFEKKDELPMYESFTGWEKFASALDEAGYASAPRFVFTGTLHSRAGSAPLVFNAVDPERENRLLRYPSYMEAGRFPRPGRRELAVGTMAADKLRLGIPFRTTRKDLEEDLLASADNEADRAFVAGLYGPAGGEDDRPFAVRDAGPAEEKLVLRKSLAAADRERLWGILAGSGRMDVRISVVLDVKTETGKIRHVNQLIDAVVSGVVNSPNPKTNGNTAYLPLADLQDETGLMLRGRVTELLVRAADADDSALPGKKEAPETVKRALEARLAAGGETLPDDLDVRGWRDYVSDYLAASAGDNVSSRVMIAFLFVLSFIGIANTMLMAVLERTKETGMLRALGMTDGEVLLVYVLEAACIGAIGAAAGIVLGCLVNIPMVIYGIDYSAMSEEMGGDYGYRITAYFRSAWNPLVIVLTGAAAVFVSAGSAVLPTLRALRLPVTESLRFE